MKEWEDFLFFLRQKNATPPDESWRSQCQLEGFDAQNLYLSFKDVFSLNFFKEHIGPQLKHFKNANHHLIKVHAELQKTKSTAAKEAAAKPVSFHFTEDPHVSFDQFVTNTENKFLFELFQNLPEHSKTFNPLFIYGAKSSGKTHLLKAAFNHYRRLGFKAIYVDAETFSEHVVYAMRQSAMAEFRKLYRQCQMLFFDNVQLLEGKTATQEEFFHTFNSLQMSSKTIVIASNAPASFLKMIEPRLISRFEWGLSLEVAALKKEDYPRLIKSLTQKLEISLTAEHSQLLFESFSHDITTLTSALHAVVLRSHLDNNRSSEHISSTLEDLKTEKKALTLEEIVEAVAKFFSLKAKDLKGPSQTRLLGFPRQIALYLIRKHLGTTYKKLGEFFQRDHSTIMASVTAIEEKLKTLDETTLNAVTRIEWELKKP